MAHRRTGISRLELLVAGGIAVLLAGFLLPAIQKLRLASNRSECTNNLRGLGAGVLSYHQANRRLPPGGSHTEPELSAGLSAECREREWSWAYHILPHVGRAEIYNDPDANAVRTAEIPLFACPARRSTRSPTSPTMLDYAANAGTNENGIDGVIRRSTRPAFTLAELTDGTASTVLAFEKRLNIADLGNTPGDTHGFATPGWTNHFEAHRTGSLPPAADRNIPGDRTAFSEAGSSHPNVFNAVFADGTVRTIRFSVDPTVWRRACVRDDNQQFNFNDL